MAIRSLLIPLLALSASTIAASPLAAQQTPSVEGYLCTFAGKCDGATTETVTKDAPETKGFRLARPVADKSSMTENHGVVTRVAAPATVRQTRAPASGGYTSSRRETALANSMATGGAVATAPRMASAGRPRADLMIGFELNSAQLSADGVRSAQVFAKSLLLPELKSKRFLIEGHTDLRGGRGVNMALSRDRAKAVADYLVVLGVGRDRLETRGFGPDAPLPGHNANDPDNRRVEAELIS